MAPKQTASRFHIRYFQTTVKPAGPNAINTTLYKIFSTFTITKVQFDQILFPLMVDRNIRETGKTMTLKFQSIFSRRGKK